MLNHSVYFDPFILSLVSTLFTESLGYSTMVIRTDIFDSYGLSLKDSDLESRYLGYSHTTPFR